jgi:hypothetical protein
MRKISFSLTVIILLSFAGLGFCERPFRIINEHELRLGIQPEDKDNIYLGRLSLRFNPIAKIHNRQAVITASGEVRHSLDKNRSFGERIGLEVGSSLLDWVYLGTQINFLFSLREGGVEPHEDEFHWQGNVVITPWTYKLPKGNLKLCLSNEYSYNLTEGVPFRNEVAVTFDWEVSERLTIPVGWRHIDRVHYYDSDQIEIGAIMTF